MPILYGEGREQAWKRLEREGMLVNKGLEHDKFSLVFSLAGATTDTQHFVAREGELQTIHEHLDGDGIRKVVILHGLGGIGKTQLAISYAKRHRNDYSAVLWLNAKDETSVQLSYVRLAKQILRDHPEAPRVSATDLTKIDEVVEAVKIWLSMSQNTRWLLIFDNYDNPKVPGSDNPAALDLERYFPEAYQGSVLITSRSAEVALGHRVHVQKLQTLQDCLQILGDLSGRAYPSTDQSAVRLAERIDGLPLALATAGAYLRQSSMTSDEYLQAFEKSWSRLQQHSPALMTYQDRMLYSTWQISYERIQRRSSVAANMLRLRAYFDNQDLRFELLHHLSDEDEPWMRELTQDKISFDACMRLLCDHGLVEINAGNPSEVESMGYSVHACVHAWMSAVLEVDTDQNLARAALLCVAAHVPDQDQHNWPFVQRRLLEHANHYGKHSLTYAMDYRDVTWTVHNLGDLYRDQGKLEEAEEMFERALRGHEKALGPEHTSTLNTVNSLGILYRDQGKLAEAEQMYERALRGKEKALGSEHTSVLGTVHNLGILYSDQGKLAEAEQIFERALRGYEKALGPEHPSTLDTVLSLGLLYSGRGKLEKALGPEHTSTLDTVDNLALLTKDQDRSAEAEGLYDRALKGYQKALGLNHVNTIKTIICLIKLQIAQGREEEAATRLAMLKHQYNSMNSRLRNTVDQLEGAMANIKCTDQPLVEDESKIKINSSSIVSQSGAASCTDRSSTSKTR